ncbi:FG-GAP repeat domain-containing protein [Thermosipho atlanticus]|uniref:Repeat domain-containing protein n=1 Tax=Thermosipho atlanticus DSM 15807 TaxID=1123380 RepID=A0A1M5RT70_9BACT|nr:VCBS repeat-containing protein [Thermosipho atlanticus]SHH29013.1 Repeat domain-containing protein [Thermosipho atlanticus DSM 15807]
MLKRLLITYLILLQIVLIAGTFTAKFPILNYSQQYPEKAWGAIFIKNIATRVIEGKIVAVNVYKINAIYADSDSGPFSDVSQTFAVDYNNDGYADIISLTYHGKVVIKENKKFDDEGNLILKDIRKYYLPVYNGDGTMIIDDFDNDGSLDMFSYNSWFYAQYVNDVLSPKQISYHRINYFKVKIDNRSAGSGFVTNWTVSAMASFDYNGDGFKDILYVDRKGRFWVWLNDYKKGINRFFNEKNIIFLFEDRSISSDEWYGGGVLDVGDVNNDGIIDIVAGHTNKKNIIIYFGKMVNNKLTFSKKNSLKIVENDGKLGPTTFVDPSIPNSKSPKSLPSFSPTIIKISDIDRDGYKDIFVGTDAWRQRKNFGGSVYLFKGVGITNDNKPQYLSLELVHGSYSYENNPPYDFDAGTIGDLDNDGIPDFVAADGNHSGNFYKIFPRTSKLYVTERGVLISDYIPNVVGILPKDLPQNFIKKITVTLKFDKSLGNGFFEVRYIKSGIKDPQLIDVDSYPLAPGCFPKMPIQEEFTSTIVFNKPVPDPQIIVVLFPESETSAPHLVELEYIVETQQSQVIIKNFNWSKGE